MVRLILLFATLLAATVFAEECEHRDYGHGSTVCVCTEAKCDNFQVKLSKDAGVATTYLTSKKGARFERKEVHFAKEAQTGHLDVEVEVNHAKKFQKILGFGGAFTDAAGINIAKLPTKLQNRLMRDYFGEDGIEYRVGRIPIGGSDFSTRAYSYDDHPGDEELSKFALEPEDIHYKLPYLRMAQEISNHSVKLFGSPWSSPAWMKTNEQLNHGGFLKGEPGGKYYKMFAKYFVKFLQEYATNNVTLWGLTVENEPGMGFNPNYRFNCLGFNATLERDFVKLDLGPELAASGFGNLKLMIFDDNTPQMEAWITTVLSDKDAAKYISGVAYHWYSNHNWNRSSLDHLATHFQNAFFLSTEACEEWNNQPHHVSLGNWATFNRYADDIIKDLNHYTVGWVDWNLVLDLEGGPNWVKNFVDAPIIVNETAHEYYKQPFFYALGHFSKFLVPDSVRVDHQEKHQATTTKDDGTVLVTVFERPDKASVATVLNKNAHPIKLQLHDPARGYLVVDVAADSLESLIWY